ncbi:hypothetical protein BCR32DRAFT_247430 [Anaeromyces robustus]|uniref:Ankyrin n=1 Tax=Anaeromyces robustus TaxID=1754192 RepID=A0A1Y1WX41_9FUNG|nr:hypothetical protein BCR32DRAFT_247430 [Anaeromyces robustus]|eukprot:ORX78100.1 hypothetical protein BCR32DRAFT_247430 [Anaeromyces robustus]
MNRKVNSLERKKIQIIDIIDSNNLYKLKNYIKEINISLKELNNNNFDLLIYAIEHFASIDIIDFIIKQCQYETLNYSIYDYTDRKIYYNNGYSQESYYGIFKVPLFSSISINNFKVANLLIKNCADINFIIDNFYVIRSNFKKEFCFGDIVHYLNIFNLLQSDNLKYILNKGFNINIVNTGIISELINDKMENQLSLINTIFKHYIFDNDFILKLLHIYKNSQSLSVKQLRNIIFTEKRKIEIKDSYYNKELCKKDNEVLKLLMNYDSRIQ